MKPEIEITGEKIVLRTIKKHDVEFCRTLKNNNRRVFFFMDIITKQQQKEWYTDYLTKKDEFVFLLYVRMCCFTFKVGSIGFRIRNDYVDLFNIMIKPMFKNKGYMGNAIYILVLFLNNRYPTLPVGLFVKRDNYEGYMWYLKHGFVKKNESDTYYFLHHKGLT